MFKGIFGGDVDMRIERIVSRLLKLTKSHAVTWRLEGDVATTKFDDLTARITPGFLTPLLYIYDSSGRQLTAYSGAPTSPSHDILAPFAGNPKYGTTTVSELYETAKRIASGIDEKLDVIDAALDRAEIREQQPESQKKLGG